MGQMYPYMLIHIIRYNCVKLHKKNCPDPQIRQNKFPLKISVFKFNHQSYGFSSRKAHYRVELMTTNAVSTQFF